MALKQQVETQFGITLPAGYVRVLSIAVNYGTDDAQITLAVYADEASRKADKQPVATPALRCKAQQLDGKDVRKAAYEYLKTLEAFQSAEDC